MDVESPFVHYYNRGVNKAKIFFRQAHFDYLIQTMNRFLSDYPIQMLTYCLMPNHDHILLKHEKNIDGSPFIQRVFNTYTQAVNHQIDHVGTLFQGSVKKRFIDGDDYLMSIILYIHLNPVKSGLCNRPEDWPYSDYREWIGRKKTIRGIINERERLFGTAQDYLELINSEIQNISLAR